MKRKLEMGCSSQKKKPSVKLSTLLLAAKKSMKIKRNKSSQATIKSAQEGARAVVTDAGGKNHVIINS